MHVEAPGVYVEETPAGGHVIAGVPTSTAAFLGATSAGPVAAPVLVHSFAQFQAQFGGLSEPMPLGYAVQQFFLNGGHEALIARVVPGAAALTDADLSSPALEPARRGLWLLEHAERFDILCIPPLSRTVDVGPATWEAAVAYAQRRRAMVIVDPPTAWASVQDVSEAAIAALLRRSPNAALYYPRLTALDPLRGNQAANFAPCGAVAGVYARTDAARGVWTAPAGAAATVLGITGPSTALTDAQLSALNPMGVNGVRVLPGGGFVLWGARTLAGNDSAEPFKFVPVRRLDIFIESSITRGLRWAVFEPNGEPLWAQIRASVADFLHGLFREGAFAGDRPEQAFFVRCDASTMTQQDIDHGIIHVVVGFAPLRPAEFVIIDIGTVLSQRYRIRTGRYTLRVMWDGQLIAGVIRVRGLGQLTELTTVREGGDPNSSRLVVGPTTFAPVTLVRPVARDEAFATWAQAMPHAGGAAPAQRKDVRIELHDGERGRIAAWVLKDALPVKFEAPDFNAASSDVAIEELTLAHEGLQRADHDP